MSDALVGIFVGGRSQRMGGIPKGLLRHPTEPTTLVQRALSLGQRLPAETVLVGQHEAYANLGIEMLADAPAGVGPIGGLAALVDRASGRDAIAIACDMPFVPIELVRRLVATPGGTVVATRRAGQLEPLCALYRPGVRDALQRSIAQGQLSLRGILASLEVSELVLSPEQERWLDDWDAPSDVIAG